MIKWLMFSLIAACTSCAGSSVFQEPAFAVKQTSVEEGGNQTIIILHADRAIAPPQVAYYQNFTTNNITLTEDARALKLVFQTKPSIVMDKDRQKEQGNTLPQPNKRFADLKSDEVVIAYEGNEVYKLKLATP